MLHIHQSNMHSRIMEMSSADKGMDVVVREGGGGHCEQSAGIRTHANGSADVDGPFACVYLDLSIITAGSVQRKGVMSPDGDRVTQPLHRDLS